MTDQEMVDLYVKTLNGPENGWGQNIVDAPKTKYHGAQSHWLRHAISQRMGADEATLAIERAFMS